MPPSHRPHCDAGAGLDVGPAITALMRAMRAAKAAGGKHTGAAGVDLAAFPLLNVVHERGPLRANTLAEAVHSDPSTVSRQVAHLVELGYLRRLADPSDKRATLLEATDRGRAALNAQCRQRDAFLAGLLADWPAAQRHEFALLLHRFAEALTAAVDRAGTHNETSAPMTPDRNKESA